MTDSLLQRLAAALVSRPFVYDLVQNLAGQAKVAARLRSALDRLPRGRILDVGSASGEFVRRVTADPVCLDLEARSLLALRRRRAMRVVAADAAALPFADRSFDLTLCVAVSHHLDENALERVVSELARVTADRLVFLDALRNDGRTISRCLWRLDRGRHPRSAEELRAALGRRFRFRHIEEFTILHQYLLCVASSA